MRRERDETTVAMVEWGSDGELWSVVKVARHEDGGTIMEGFDFWSYQGDTFYEKVACGGHKASRYPVHFHALAGSAGERGAAWWDDTLVVPVVSSRLLPWRSPRYRQYLTRRLWLGPLDLRALRIDRVRGPRPDPFTDAYECSDNVYCSLCDERFPDPSNDPCEHVTWDEDLGAWSGPGCEP